MVLHNSLSSRLEDIQSKIYKTAISCNRNAKNITIVAVTKTHPSPIWEMALNAGIKNIGENKIQETIKKQQQFTSKDKIIFHLIGHLQKNKIRKAIETFDVIQTVDSLELAKKINYICEETNKIQEIYLQVNTNNDPKKFGMKKNTIMENAHKITKMNNLNLTGIMTIPRQGLLKKELSKVYFETRQIKNQIQNKMNNNCKNLSMGMSNDFEVAIKEGATHIRIGTALFGIRK